MEEKKKEDIDEWLKLVHEGTCCAQDDPMKEEKKAFIKKLKKDENKEGD